MKNAFAVVRQDTPVVRDAWMIIETFWTSEGPRCRVCSGRWGNKDEAHNALRMLQLERDRLFLSRADDQ